MALLWLSLLEAFIAYARFIQTKEESYRKAFDTACENLLSINEEGKKVVGEKYYPMAIGRWIGDYTKTDTVSIFVADAKESLEKELEETLALESENLVDFVVCGGGNEGHKIQKEVNFSDTCVTDEGIFRIPGTGLGKAWSMVNAHGWFSYELKVKPNQVNEISVFAKGSDGKLNYSIDLDGEKTLVNKEGDELTETLVRFTENKGNTTVRIRIDRTTGYTPYIYQIKVK